ncbi:MAG: protein kinase [Myxococcota bacterium]
MALPNRDPFLGLTLDGKYEVVSAIARGGMGRVYRAIQQPLGREVALKILDLDQLEGKKAGGDFAKRFFLEAASCAKLTHPNTIVVYDYGRAEDDIFYIAMELLEGNTLDDILEASAPIDPAVTIHVGLQICGSIGEAHQQGMVHRDLKPSNVMVIARGADSNFAKVLDFGLVKQDSDVGLTQTGALLGTPRYISPEQIANADVGPTSDIYSLGAVMYHCLTGRPPFDSDSKFVLLASHINVEPPAIEELQPTTPSSPQLREVIMRCLQKEPADRFQTMEELAEALMACPEESGTAASSMVSSVALSSIDVGSLPRREPDRSGVMLADEAIEPAPENEGKPSPLFWVALLAGLLIGAGGIAWWWLGRAEPVPVAEVAEVAEPAAESAPAIPEEPSEPSPMEAAAAATTRVEVQTSPEGASIRRDGRDLGDAPVTLVIPEGESWSLTVALSGYESREISVTGGQGVANIRLRRQRRGSTMRPSSPPPEETVMAPAMEETPMETPMAGTMAPEGGMRPRTDNRDPWAR